MEPFCLLVVDGIFTISGRGFIVTPSLPVAKMTATGYNVNPVVPPASGIRMVRPDDRIELRRPNGTTLPSVVAINHAKLIDGGSAFPLRLPDSVGPEDVPVGTEICWITAGKE
jgi:hypothetical protein